MKRAPQLRRSSGIPSVCGLPGIPEGSSGVLLLLVGVSRSVSAGVDRGLILCRVAGEGQDGRLDL